MERTEFYEQIVALCREGHPFLVATVVGTTGSTPRPLGSKMVILADGSTVDTIGGGALELQVVKDALACLKRGDSRLVEYELTPVGDHALGTLCGGRASVLLEVHVAARSLVIVGAGHIAHKLCPMAKLLGFRVVVLDSRAEYATQQRFPDADEIICDHPGRTAEVVSLGVNAHVVILTHGHIHDKEALRSVIGSDAAYIGMIGSRTKVRTILSELTDEGIDSGLLARVHAPIGLDLGGHTPAEISVSIMSEIVAQSYDKLHQLKSLRGE